jgi:hypothetical protein
MPELEVRSIRKPDVQVDTGYAILVTAVKRKLAPLPV